MSRISAPAGRRRALERGLIDPLRRRPISPELRAEVEAEPGWMYPWRLTRGVTTPIHADFLQEVHQTREEMIEPTVREALAKAGPDATAIDLACNEGWFSQRLLDWGASRVVGVDIRDVNVRRAELVRDHYGIDPDRLQFMQRDLYGLTPSELGSFDVVVFMGIFYHVEDPTGAFRVARSLCDGICVIEGQVTRQREPITWGAGAGTEMRALGSFAIYHEPDSEENPLASTAGVLSLIPNRRALHLMSKVAGFSQLELLKPPPLAHHQYAYGDRIVGVARTS